MSYRPYADYETRHFERHKAYRSTKCLLEGKIHKGKGANDDVLVVRWELQP